MYIYILFPIKHRIHWYEFYMNIQKDVYMHTCMCIHVYSFTPTHIYIYIYITHYDICFSSNFLFQSLCIYIYIHLYAYIFKYAKKWVYIHICMIYIYTYTDVKYIYIYIYTYLDGVGSTRRQGPHLGLSALVTTEGHGGAAGAQRGGAQAQVVDRFIGFSGRSYSKPYFFSMK